MTARGRLLPDPDERILIVPVYLNGTEILALRSAAARDPRLAKAAQGAESMLGARGYDLPEADSAAPSYEELVAQVRGAIDLAVGPITGAEAHGPLANACSDAYRALDEITKALRG